MLQFLIANRAFRFLWLGQIFSQLAMNSLIFTLALVVYRQTGSNTAVSGLFLAFGVPALLFGMVAGTVVDRLDRKMVLLLCDVIRAALVLFLFFSSKTLYLYIFWCLSMHSLTNSMCRQKPRRSQNSYRGSNWCGPTAYFLLRTTAVWPSDLC